MTRTPSLSDAVGLSATFAAGIALLPAVAFFLGWQSALAEILPGWMAGLAQHDSPGGVALLFASGICATVAVERLLCRGRIFACAPFRALSADDLERSGRQLDVQLAGALEAFQAYAERTGQYGDSLRQGRARLEAATDAERVRAAVRFLVAENDKMTQSNAAARQRLIAATKELQSLRAELNHVKAENERDSLTNAFSRRHFDAALAAAILGARGEPNELSLVMVDIDHFKAINDTHGHPVGDEFLKQFAAVLARNVKGRDCVARYGGEEFAIVMPATPLDAAAIVSEQIRAHLARTKWRRSRGEGDIGTVTASFGVAALQPGDDAAALIERADARLYEAKRFGRNRVSK